TAPSSPAGDARGPARGPTRLRATRHAPAGRRALRALHSSTAIARLPLAGADVPGSRLRLAPAELVELRVVDAEEVRDLVDDGNRDLLDHVLARLADRERGVAEDEDPVGQLPAAPVASLGE